MCLIIVLLCYYNFLVLSFIIIFLFLQFKCNKIGRFQTKPVSFIVRPGTAAEAIVTMRQTDQQLLILQYKTSGGVVTSDFVANKIQILSCALLPEYERHTREDLGLSTEEVYALISDYIKMRPANDRVFNKILSVEYVFNLDSNVQHTQQTALTARLSEQAQAVADSGSAANAKRGAEITEQVTSPQATEKRTQL